jgi:2-polyprenyl-3-methyl-5-hydroxy-6-metoxy-1,4-benzoquinol methylase
LRHLMAALASWNDDTTRPLLVWEGLPDSIAAGRSVMIPPLRTRFLARAPRACCLGALDGAASAPVDNLEDIVMTRPQVRANSFNFVRTAVSVPTTSTAAACTAYAAAREADASRHVWLIEDDRLVLYVTDTGDFSLAEIAQVKDELSHLFVDRAAPGVLDDFAEGMRRVLPDATCDVCPNRDRCGRRFRVIEGAPFRHEEAWIGSYIGGLRGRVLDVGCGEQLYQDQIGPLLRAGTVQYTGLDPDEVSLTRVRAALPEGRFYQGGIEDFEDEPASYDHILCLRSLNHVTDVDEALARMAALLKPTGSLLLVECIPFAMLRRPEQVAAADRAPRAGHQHFRNVSSEDVLPWVRRRALRVLQHHRASLATTNEWILLLGRSPAAAV